MGLCSSKQNHTETIKFVTHNENQNTSSKNDMTSNYNVIQREQKKNTKYNIKTSSKHDMAYNYNEIQRENIELIKHEMEIRANALSEKLNIDSTKCLFLLRKYQWNIQEIIDIFNTNNDCNKILSEYGISIPSNITHHIDENEDEDNKAFECKICMKTIQAIKCNSYCMECNHHKICELCWIDYLKHATKTKQCLFTTCPQYQCNLLIKHNIFELFLKDKFENEYQRYLRFCRIDFIQNCSEFVMCPGMQCEMALKTDPNLSCVKCSNCNNTFCPKCKHMPHPDMSCSAVSWCQSSKNLLYIIKNTKSCPKCNKRIESHENCNHMTCRRHAGGCGHEFCWLCLKDWRVHGWATGGYYQCNIYEKDKTLYDNNKNDEKQLKKLDFLMGFLNFNTMKQNMLFLFFGYGRDDDYNLLYIPLDIIECCIAFYIEKMDYDFHDQWNEDKRVLIDKDSNILQLNENEVHTISVNTKLEILRQTLMRKVWKIKILCLDSKWKKVTKFEIGLNKDIYMKLEYDKIKNGDVISVLLINYYGSGLMKFAINGQIIKDKTIMITISASSYHLQVTISPHLKLQLLV